MTNATASKSAKFLAALQAGEELTAKQIAARFGIGNPTATVSDLRLRGGCSRRLQSIGSPKGFLTLRN